MSNFDTFQLTHPELMSETELRDILRNRCIDFSHFERLSRSELIEMYKRVAMPLPQRRQENGLNTDMDTNSADASYNMTLSNNATNFNMRARETPRTSQFYGKRPNTSPCNHNHVSKEIRLSNSRNGTECNGIQKRNNDGRHNDESPSKKRQKITWP